MEYLASSIFAQALQRTSIAGAVLVVTVLGAVILAFTYIKSRIEAAHQAADLRAQALAQEVATRTAAGQSLLAEVRETRQQLLDCLARDTREKNRLARTLGSLCAENHAQVKVLDCIKASLDAHNRESVARHESIKEELIRVQERRA